VETWPSALAAAMAKWDPSGILRQEIDVLAAAGFLTLLHLMLRRFFGIMGARCAAYNGKTLPHPKAA
jgi:hypothetical protein